MAFQYRQISSRKGWGRGRHSTPLPVEPEEQFDYYKFIKGVNKNYQRMQVGAWKTISKCFLRLLGERGWGVFFVKWGVVVRTIMFDIAVAVLVNEEGGGGKKCVLIRKCSLTLTFGFER